VPESEVFVADREAWPLHGTVKVTARDASSPPFSSPRLHPLFEGGWSGLSLARDAGGGFVPDEFWVVTDRGPNYAIEKRVPAAPRGAGAFGRGAKYFPLPAYQQKIQRIRLDRATGKAVVVSSTGIRTRHGSPTVGLPSNAAGMTTAEVAYADPDDGGSGLAASSSGFNLEGIAEDRLVLSGVERRVFWTVDEYGPSVQMIEADPALPAFGRILREYVPGVSPDPASGMFSLPAVLRRRRDNRGFEGVAVTSRAVWAMVQSSFEASFGDEDSRLHRLLRLDKATGAAVTYGYEHLAEPEALGSKHADVKVSDMCAFGEREFLVLEHGRAFTHLYRIRVDDGTTPLLESEDGAYEKGAVPCVPVGKTLVADLTPTLARLETPPKPEGMALVDPSTLALCFDNDYGFDTNDVEVYPHTDDHARNVVVLLRLDAPLRPSV
jgi:hypothetical protein